jgi:hypothetical protein
VVNGAHSGVVAGGSGTKAVAEVLAGLDGGGGPWTAVSMMKSASAARADREWEGEAMTRGGNEMGWRLSRQPTGTDKAAAPVGWGRWSDGDEVGCVVTTGTVTNGHQRAGQKA